MQRIVTFGELLLRLSKPGCYRLTQGERFNGNYGGSEANVAVALAQLGNDVEYITRVPDNAIGDAALMHLREFGLDTSHIVRGGHRLGAYYFEAAAGLRNSKVSYDRANSSFYDIQPDDVPWTDVLRGATAFHSSGITCAVSQSALDTTMKAVETAHRLGVKVTCDINYRKNLWQYPGADAHATLNELMKNSDFIFGDQNEWETGSGVQHIPFTAQDAHYAIDRQAYTEYFEAMQQQFPHCRYMLMALRNQLSSTHHVLTGVLWSQGRLYTTRIYDILPVIDPMGCGDAFVAAFIHALTVNSDIQHNLDFAISASALKNTIPGDQNLVSREEILANMTSSGGRIQR